MPSKLRVLAGPSPSSLSPITVNTSQAHDISSDLFEGKIVVHIKGFNDIDGQHADDDEYFKRADRQGVTWSIQVQGRFLHEFTADDVLFGNTFDRPLKLPWGTSAILKFMNFIDPTLDHDLQSSTKPWALSPLIATMPYFAHSRVDGDTFVPEFPSRTSLQDDISQLGMAVKAPIVSSAPSTRSVSPVGSVSSLSSSSTTGSTESKKRAMMDRLKTRSHTRSSSSQTSSSTSSRSKSKHSSIRDDIATLQTSAHRRSYFSSPEKRSQVVFGPSDVITVDFCYGFLSFGGTSSGPRLDLPAGLHFDLGKYWDGQPVRFMCCQRNRGDGPSSTGDPWGQSFWCVAIEMVNDESEEGEGGSGSEGPTSDID